MWFSRVVLVCCCWEVARGARILGIFPTPSISHQVVFRALTQELAKRGHELIILTPDPERLHPNITEIDAHKISYSMWNKEFINRIMEDERNRQITVLKVYRYFKYFTLKMFDTQMSLPEVQALLQSNEHFDLILIEGIFRMAHAFRHRFKAPLIAVNSMAGFTHNYEAIGVPSHPIYFPDIACNGVVHYTLIKKIEALCVHLSKYYYDWYFVERANEIIKKYFGADTPDLRELESQMDMMFFNANPIWDGIRPTTPNVIYMWGTHLKPAKELPANLKSYLDNSTHGVAYMSLGTNVKSSELPEDRLDAFLEAFRRLPYDVLWKWEAEDLPGKPDNVRIEKWLPQADLLKHPNVKVFIMQGGLQSTDEALFAAVPLVGIPFFRDQESNAVKFVKHGVGVMLDIKTLTDDILENAIITVAQSEKYRKAVQRMSRLVTDSVDGGTGVSRAANYAEYVIRHGGAAHLRSPTAGVSFSDYFMLDVVAVVMLAGALLVIALVITLRFILNQLRLLKHTYKLKKHVD